MKEGITSAKVKKILSIGVFSSCALHIMGMIFMLGDHLWATIFPYLEILTCVGRIAFPIFAFLSVEGYFHTGNLNRYLLRLWIFAMISEVPFDLLYGSTAFYPYHQNVIWTFLIGLICIMLIDMVRKKQKLILTILVSVVVAFLGLIIGTLTMVDYYGAGVLMVIMFYLFRGKKLWNYLAQLVAMYYINVELLGGYYYPIEILGHTFEFKQQGIALLALIPIWLYSGKKGYNKVWFKYFCYAFYPAHCLIIYFVWNAVNGYYK